LKPLPQSLVIEKLTEAWGKITVVEELLPGNGVGDATGGSVATGVGVGVATGVGAGVGVATGVGDGAGEGVDVPVPEGLPIKGARLD